MGGLLEATQLVRGRAGSAAGPDDMQGPGFSLAPTLSASGSHGGGRNAAYWVAAMPSKGGKEGVRNAETDS